MYMVETVSVLFFFSSFFFLGGGGGFGNKKHKMLKFLHQNEEGIYEWE